MSYATVRDGIVAGLGTISGIKSNLNYLPTSVEAPGVYTILERKTRPVSAGLRVEMFDFVTYLFVAWQHNKVAEDAMVALMDDVETALKLGDFIVGSAWITTFAAEPVFITVSNTTYRALRFSYTVKETNG